MIEWSNEQSNILNWFAGGNGNLVVRARAGTGKTTVLIEGISRAPESRILLAAFNKSIAEELQKRIRGRGEAKTLHSLGFSIIQKTWGRVTMDKDRGKKLAEKAANKRYGSDVPFQVSNSAARLAAMVKGVNPDAHLDDIMEIAYMGDYEPSDESNMRSKKRWTIDHVGEIAADALDLACENTGSIDFDDMVYIPVRMRWRNPTYQLVCIDECQDMNAAQITLALSVALPNARLAVVGDDRQAVYGFRGADSGSVDRLKKELSAKEMPMTITRRCPRSVVRLAARIVPDFKAAPQAPDGEVKSCSLDAMLIGAGPGDFVLSRKNVPLVRACMDMLRTGKKAMIRGRDLGQGLLGLVRGLKATSITEMHVRLNAWEEREIEKASRNAKTAEGKIELISEKASLLRVLAEGCPTVAHLSTNIETLFTDDDGKGSVICSTVHRAKGLEADRVYVMMDTMFYPDPRSPRGREEENIRYVGFTRAKKELVLVSDPKAPESVKDRYIPEHEAVDAELLN